VNGIATKARKKLEKHQIKMDFKKIKTETTVVTRQKDQFYKGTGNIYETVPSFPSGPTKLPLR
jgi:hypothetical protein